MEKRIFSLLITALFCLLLIGTAQAYYNPFGDTYGIMGGAGSIGRVSRLWEYKGGGLIGVDDFTRGMRTTYLNGRPIYAKITLPPDITTATDVSFNINNPEDPTEVLLANLTISDINLMQFFGQDKAANGSLISTTELEDFIKAALTDAGKKKKDGSDFTNDDIGKIAAAVRDQVAQRIAAYGAAAIDSSLFSQSEVVYEYDKLSGQIKTIKRTATDDEGQVLRGTDGKVQWTKETYEAGLLTQRETHIYNYKLTATGDIDRDANGKPILDKTRSIEVVETFEYAKGASYADDPTGETQIGMVMTTSRVIADPTPDVPVPADSLIQPGDEISRVEYDEFGRAAQEFGIARIDKLSATPIVMGLLTEHVYNDSNGLEAKTVNYSYSDENVMAMRITDLSYNGANQLSGTTTKLMLIHFVKSATDDNQDGDMTDPGEAAVETQWDEEKGTVGSSVFYYNSMGQRYFVDSIDVDIDNGTSNIVRTYYAYNRDLVSFSRNPATASEPVPLH